MDYGSITGDRKLVFKSEYPKIVSGDNGKETSWPQSGGDGADTRKEPKPTRAVRPFKDE